MTIRVYLKQSRLGLPTFQRDRTRVLVLVFTCMFHARTSVGFARKPVKLNPSVTGSSCAATSRIHPETKSFLKKTAWCKTSQNTKTSANDRQYTHGGRAEDRRKPSQRNIGKVFGRHRMWLVRS